MVTKNIKCELCEAEFYVETSDSIEFCITCGEELNTGSDSAIDMDEEEWEDY